MNDSGGGEGATLREVLKHNTVREAVMIEIDGELTNISRTYLPEWSDCSDIMAESDNIVASSCFDNSRATVHFEDAFGYFLGKFGKDYNEGYGNETVEEEKLLFDVIIMDALDPGMFH